MEKIGVIAPNSTFSFHVPENNPKTRIDRFICDQFPGYSRNFFQQLIDDGLVSLNGTPICKPSIVVKQLDTITVTFPQERKIKPETINKAIFEKKLDIEVIFEHEHFLILCKPTNLLVHTPSTASNAVTLTDWLLLNYPNLINIGYTDRPGIIHRLDKDTSGIIIISRTPYAHTAFSKMFKDRTIQKTYRAVVHGHPEKTGSINHPIGRNPQNRRKMMAFSTGNNNPTKKRSRPTTREAYTNYNVLEYFNDYALVEAKPITGRTHQIRVHFSSIGHPIVGDPVYGKKSKLIKRQALHAYALSFTFDNKQFSFSKDVPDDYKQLLHAIRNKN